MINKSVCFSGHRPHKLPHDSVMINVLKSRLYKEVSDCVANGYTDFYTGCALGVDMWAAIIVLNLKKDNPALKLHCVIPYEGHCSSWGVADKFNLRYILDCADSVECISKKYHRGCYSERNKYIVDNSSLLIAVYNDMRSGTGQTIKYAREKGIDIVDLYFEP